MIWFGIRVGGGSIGFLAVGYTLDATVALSGPLGSSSGVVLPVALVCSNFNLSPGNSACLDPGFLSQSMPFASSVSGTFVFPQFFMFRYGTPFDFFFSLSATTDVGSGGTAITDAGNTLILSGLRVYDSQGNVVPGATFTSASGTVYTQNGIVPEPRATSLLLAVVTLIGISVRKPGWTC